MKVIITEGHDYRLTPGDYWFLENIAARVSLTGIFIDES